MGKFKSFVKTSVLGGLLVILPVALVVLIFGKIYHWISAILLPLTLKALAITGLQSTVVAQAVAVAAILVVCFALGAVVRTRVGRFFHGQLEDHVLRLAPGYALIKETLLQFLGHRKSPFSSVALARIFQNDTLVTAFVTDEHPDGWYTLFVPSGLNPTSGMICHLSGEYVTIVDARVEDAMRSIISCGAGSGRLIESLRKADKAQNT